MKRLVYAPKVYIFIRSSNLDRIYDVSSDVVSGSVTQNMGDMSKATFELRNRYQKWIRDSSGKESIFLPMDLVTIWLQRVAGRPIQVFTGYLDSVPYYQGFPGNARFEASCTLKRLAYTWFDPGLEFFQQWVLSNDGWVYDPTTGEAQNPNYNFGSVNVSNASSPDKSSVNDGGFAELLGRFMIDIAGWDANDVLISELPKDLPQVAAKLYTDIHDSTNTDLANLAQFLGTAMGVPGYSGATGASASTSDGLQPNTSKANKVITTMQKVADQNGIPILVLALAAFVLTGFNDAYSHDSTEHDLYGYGLFAMRPDRRANTLNPSFNPGGVGGTTLPVGDIDGHAPKDLLDANLATQLFCKRLIGTKSKYIQAAKSNDLKAISAWITSALGRPFPQKNITTAFEKAKQYAHSSVVVAPTNVPATAVNATQIDFNSTSVQKLLTPKEKSVAKVRYKNAEPWLAAFIHKAKAVSPRIELTNIGSAKDEISFTSTDTKALKNFFNSLAHDLNIDSARLTLGGKVTMLVGGVLSSLPDATNQGYTDAVLIHQSKAPPDYNVTSTSSGGDSATGGASGGSGSATLEQLAAFSANAAFAANFAFPSNRIESKFLTGNRALMNDVSCLDGVKQFCQASMRTFRSMPDGRFLAFYPDYFGVHRKPYWAIQDIEIIDIGIQLNDEALATHVYVVGDTFALDGKIDWLDEATTRGVATLTQAFMLGSFMEPYDGTLKGAKDKRLGRLQDAWAFLQHYGARPHKEEQPLIRNTAYEFLMAWQRFMQLWASTFATNVEFTFQPEVMAGGLVEFPDHDLQMYCEQVTHNFSYEGGFTTSAVMSSPALTKSNNDRTTMPGFALAGNINTVGVA